ncbi:MULTISPECIES: hypothetical protein [Halorubrum]|uniref:hypothetical protein n=1 Tax=Halorubrum TaxID=56688 RepID=UPI0010F9F096|nr:MULTISPECIES: hypothetical protein [Halorubrum]TKX72946.1 hypothetical protein EXE40_01320 [Halorubrum sp. GN11GM_10-3_MGM]
MGVNTYEHIDTMLKNAQQDLTDSEIRFKLRTARQLCDAMKRQYTEGQQVIERADIDEETIESLRDLGYLD